MEQTNSRIPTSYPLELFLTNIKLYKEYFPFFHRKGVTTIEKLLLFKDYPTKRSPNEEKNFKRLMNNIRSIYEPISKIIKESTDINQQIIFFLSNPIVLEGDNILDSKMMLNAFKTSTKMPNYCLPNKFQSQNLKPSSIFSINAINKKIAKLDLLNTNFTNLKHLSINDNYIQNIDLINLPNLQSLDLANNFIRKIENLEGLPNLTKLNLSYNMIYVLENLQKCEALEELDLGYQYLPSFLTFSITDACSNVNNNIQVVHLEKCNIISPQKLAQFQRLRELYLNENNIIEMMEVLTICKLCPFIEKINVVKNPFTAENKSNYRNFLILSCKNIIEIDNKEVKENEKIYVTNLFARKYGKKGISAQPKVEQIPEDTGFGCLGIEHVQRTDNSPNYHPYHK